MRCVAPVILFLAAFSFALNVDSLPVWNEAVLTQVDSLEAQEPAEDTLQLETSGSKTISVVVGDGGTEVDQELHLSMKGYVSDGVYIDALLSDVGRTAGDQSTATLQEVDEVYFRAESEHYLLHLGDLNWKQSNLGLSGIERSTLGAMVGARTNHSLARGVFGVDEVEHRTVIMQGVNGQRNGYVVDGAFGYLQVVPRSERVWLNGVELVRERDYVMNYAGGVLDFKGDVLPGLGDEIRVEYDSYNSGYASQILGAEGRYRSKHLWLDVGGFRLEDDVDRLKRSALDSNDVWALKHDDGSAFVRDDTLPELVRPKRMERAGARLRAAYDDAYMDIETAFNRKDTNTLSSRVNGPEGLAFRWNLQSDSSADLRRFPVMFGLYGNFYEDGFDASDFLGSDRDWDSYLLQDAWDLDSAGLGMGRRHDEATMRIRLHPRLFFGSELGYRQSSEDSSWNSLRSHSYVQHRGAKSLSTLSFVHVRAEDSVSSKRYQGLLNTEYQEGFVRPFASADYAYWERSAGGFDSEQLRFKQDAGLQFVANNYRVRETVGSWREQVKNDETFEDSLKQISWTQSASGKFRYLDFDHLLQYKHTDLQEAGKSDSWVSSQTVHGGNADVGIEGSLRYDFGLSREQPYVAIYKAVAAGTGDVMYDSATGQFIEGVDNGSYVYEGMGRSDTANAVEASTAEAELNLLFTPGVAFGVRNGFLRDVSFGIDFRSTGYDTTGRRLFVPPFTPSEVRKLTSGLYYVEGDVGWVSPGGALTLHYYPGNEFEKKNLTYKYTEERFWHRGTGVFTGREKEIWNLEGLYEVTDLNSVAVMDWKIYEGYASLRRELPWHFFVEPGGKVRYGAGEETSETFDALLREGDLKFGYILEDKVDASVLFSAINLDSDADYLPYQMMSGYDDGWTFRIEAFADVTLSSFFSLSSRYIVRFGNSESRLFQKWSMEARAWF